MTTTTTSIHLGPLYAFLTLAAQLVDTAGTPVGDPITTGFVEIGSNGDYLWTADVPDDHRGGVLIYEDGAPGTVLASTAINLPSTTASDLAVINANIDAIKAITDALDTSSVTVTTTNNAGELTIKRSASFRATVSGLSIPADWLAVIWTVKGSDTDDDEDSLVQVRVSNPSLPTDGLLYLAGSSSSLSLSSGSLVVRQVEGQVDLKLSAPATSNLEEAEDGVWDLRALLDEDEVLELTRGEARVSSTVTHTIS